MQYQYIEKLRARFGAKNENMTTRKTVKDNVVNDTHTLFVITLRTRNAIY